MKIVKKIAVGLVLCLAVVGAFALLKKAPKIHVPEEDHTYLKDIGIDIESGEAGPGSISALLNVKGVAPPGAASSKASSAPPKSLSASTAAPPYGAPVSEAPAYAISSDAPPFGPPAVSEAPAFSTAPVFGGEAPAFVPTPQTASLAPSYGTQFVPESEPLPAVVPAPPIPAAPGPPPDRSKPEESPPISGPAPPFWDRPASAVTVTPSLVHAVPGGASDVTGSEVQVNTSVDPFRTDVVSDFGADAFSSQTVSFPPDAFSSPAALPPTAAAAPKPMFVRPNLQRLPLVEEARAADVYAAQPVPPVPSSPVAAPETVPPNYRQTSIRSSAPGSALRRIPEGEAPKISFAVQPDATEAAAPSPIPFVAEEPVAAVESVPSVAAVPVESPAPEPTTEIRDTVSRFVKSQCRKIDSGESEQIRNAFVQLSRLYDHPELNEREREQLIPILDRLALDVVFSRKNHILESAYVVRSGDTVDSIAATHKISPALLMKINGLTGARPLEPGTKLKVVLGQFDARVSAGRSEMTLILGGLYAGRFPVTIGEDIVNVRGEFVVTSKSDSYKGKTLILGNGITLCGADRPVPGESPSGSLRFATRDADELFDILTERSVIVLEH